VRLADEMMWTRACQKAMRGKLKLSAFGIDKQFKKLEESTLERAEVIRSAIVSLENISDAREVKRRRDRYQVLLASCLCHRDIAMSLSTGLGDSELSAEYTKYLRYEWDDRNGGGDKEDPPGNCTVTIGNHVNTYGYEMFGMDVGNSFLCGNSALFISERVFLACMMGMHGHPQAMVLGGPESYREEILSAMAFLTGRITIVFNCSKSSSAKGVLNFVRGIHAIPSAWGVCLYPQQLSVEVASVLSREVLRIRRELDLSVTGSSQDKPVVTSFDSRPEDFGLFLVVKASTVGQSFLNSSLITLFRPVTLPALDVDLISIAYLDLCSARNSRALLTKVKDVFAAVSSQGLHLCADYDRQINGRNAHSQVQSNIILQLVKRFGKLMQLLGNKTGISVKMK